MEKCGILKRFAGRFFLNFGEFFETIPGEVSEVMHGETPIGILRSIFNAKSLIPIECCQREICKQNLKDLKKKTIKL